jgi:hypothetical protein
MAQAVAAKRNDSALEQVVGRLSLEPMFQRRHLASRPRDLG